MSCFVHLVLERGKRLRIDTDRDDVCIDGVITDINIPGDSKVYITITEDDGEILRVTYHT